MTDMLQKGQSGLPQNSPSMRLAKLYIAEESSEPPFKHHRKSMYDQDDGEGIVTRSQVRDFLIDTYSLLSSIIGTLPRRGDTIVEIDGDHTFILK